MRALEILGSQGDRENDANGDQQDEGDAPVHAEPSPDGTAEDNSEHDGDHAAWHEQRKG